MRSGLPRLAIILLDIILLGVIQWGVYTVFYRGRSGPPVEVYEADLSRIRAIWRQTKAVETPRQLTDPIRKAFEAVPVIEPPPEEIDEGDGPEQPYEGRLVPVGVAYPPGSGKPIVWFEYNQDRDAYVPGDTCPDGSVLVGIEKVGPSRYVIRLRDAKTQKPSRIEFEGESL